jgi:hypothetical protein
VAKATPHTVRYENGTAAVFAGVDDALLQAAHDRSWPGHLNPLFIAEGDHSETHAAWEVDKRGLVLPKQEVDVVHGLADMRDIKCQCKLCQYHHAKGMKDEDRTRLYQEAFGYNPDGIQAPILKGGAVPGAGFSITTTAIALSAATAKSVIGVVAGGNVPPDFIEFAGGGDASSGNLLIEITHGTNASNPPGTFSTIATPVQTRGPTQTPTSTAGITWTTEPTVLTVTRRWRFPWPGGPWLMQFPLGREPNAVITTSAVGKFLGIRATSTVAVTNSDWYVEIEE